MAAPLTFPANKGAGQWKQHGPDMDMGLEEVQQPLAEEEDGRL